MVANFVLLTVAAGCCVQSASALRVAWSPPRRHATSARAGEPVAFAGSEFVGGAAASVAERSSLLLADVMTDTLLDVGVYTLLAGVAGLTIYSVRAPRRVGGRTRGCVFAAAVYNHPPRLSPQMFVTVDEGNRVAGGWQKRVGDDEPDYTPRPGDTVPTDVESRLRSGAVYDPATDEWTFKDAGPTAKSGGGGGGAGAGAAEDYNRYERRARSKAKARENAKKKK